MADETTAETGAKKELEIAFARPYHDIPNYYVNVTTVRVSHADVSMVMSQQLDKTDNTLKVVPQTVVYMSHLHAKQLLELLQKSIEAHDKAVAAEGAQNSPNH